MGCRNSLLSFSRVSCLLLSKHARDERLSHAHANASLALGHIASQTFHPEDRLLKTCFVPIKSVLLPSYERLVFFAVKICTEALVNADLLPIFYQGQTKH